MANPRGVLPTHMVQVSVLGSDLVTASHGVLSEGSLGHSGGIPAPWCLITIGCLTGLCEHSRSLKRLHLQRRVHPKPTWESKGSFLRWVLHSSRKSWEGEWLVTCVGLPGDLLQDYGTLASPYSLGWEQLAGVGRL